MYKREYNISYVPMSDIYTQTNKFMNKIPESRRAFDIESHSKNT